MLLLPAEAGAFRPMKPYKFNISAHVGAGEPTFAVDKLDGGFLNLNKPSVKDMYEDRVDINRYIGTYSICFETHPLSWLSYGGSVYYTRMEGDTYNLLTGDTHVGKSFDSIYIMPEVRFFYFRTQLTTLSGTVSAGVGIYSGYPHKAAFDWQIIPLTYTIGSKVYGIAELSFGSVFMGVNFGVGVRF
ncbi:MAG: hypothetical protein ACI3ZC_01045 [Candidatus Cryptobacteroides sp.]